jgi:peptidoglycan/LPS O-acetylase OafA/YrhL
MGKNLEPLTGLRGVAAYSVLAGHLLATGFPGLASCVAYFGMSLFFVLSGFVIHYNYADRFWRDPLASSCWQFFAARFARLFPLYAVIIVFSMTTEAHPRFDEHPWVGLAYATLTQSWFNVQMTVFPPAWSISTEWFFYFAFVPLVFVVRPIERPVLALALYYGAALLAVVLVFGLFAGPLFDLVGRMFVFDPGVSADARGWTVYFAPPLRLLEFIAGMFAARAYMAQAIKPPGWLLSLIMWVALAWCGAIILAGAFTSSDASLFVHVRCNFLFAPATAAFMLCVCLSRGRISAALSSAPLQLMGKISYSVYIWQFVVMTAVASSLHSLGWSESLRPPLVIVATTVLAYGSFHLIEAPARRWLRLALTGKRPIGRIA